MKYLALLREQEMYFAIGAGGVIDNTANNYVENDYVEDYLE